MSHHRVEYDIECKECGGTGLYVGMAERDGTAVVCHRCKGTGCYHQVFEYDDFEGRKDREGVVRVLEVNPGIIVGKHTDKDTGQKIGIADFGGQLYERWKEGQSFPQGSEMRRFTCPAWWYQSANYDLKPDWDECRPAGYFSSCPLFPLKAGCWARFDREQAEKAEQKDG